MSNHEPELLTQEELLRIENIQLRREVINQIDAGLIRDIAHARMLDVKDYGKTWAVSNGRIERAPAPSESVDTPQDVAEEIQALVG